MPYTFTQDQRDELQAMVQGRNANDPAVRFDDVYEKILKFIESSGDADVETIAVFLRGAVQVNGGFGSFSEMIRGYTQRQLELRGSAGISDANMTTIMQQASNAIALNIANDIISSGELPTIKEIAENDASGAVLRFFQPNLPADDTAATAIAAGWAGTPFFSHFGDSEMWRLLSAGEDGANTSAYTMNRFDDLRNVLFAFDAMYFGLRNQTFAAWVESLRKDPRVVFDTFGDQVVTLHAAATGAIGQEDTTVARGYSLAAGVVLSAFAGSVSPALAQLFAAMGRYGQNNVLDQIRGAYLGEIRYGTTSENFLQAARDFFSSISAVQLQSMGAESLAGAGASQLADKALSGEKYRNALRGLSAFVVDLPSYDDRAVDLYDAATGAGSITKRWIDARAKMLELRMLMDQDNFPYDELWHPSGMAYASLFGDRIFSDLASGLTLGIDGIDYGIVNQIRTVFGTAAAETILGTVGRDEIFGDRGNDTLRGGADADYLEGDGGADYLFGEDGDDELVGGSGDDHLATGSGRDTLDGGADFDTYFVSSDASSVILRDADGTGTITVERADLTTYTLGSGPIRELAGSAGHYEDDEGNRYLFNGDHLVVALEDGRSITIENFQNMAGSRLGIELLSAEVAQPPSGVPTFNVGAPDQVPIPVDQQDAAFINAHGRYDGGRWVSAGAYYHRLDTEIINVAGSIYAVPVIAGMGDSYITGDDGRNLIHDDMEVRTDGGTQGGSIYGEYYMGPNMGNDWISAGGGDDWVTTRGGDDEVYGGAGNDRILDIHQGWEARVEQGISYYYDWASTEWVEQAGHSSNDRLYGEAGNDYIAAHGGNQTMDGGADNDELFAGAGSDVLSGGSGDDVLGGDYYLYDSPFVWTYDPVTGYAISLGFDGDWLRGDLVTYGNDVLDGGEGNDTLFGGGGDDVLIGGTGNDRLQGDFTNGYADLRTPLQTSYAEPLSVHGNDVIRGGDGDDLIDGGGGDDLLDGGTGVDTIHGGSGNDVVFGGAGDDEISGDYLNLEQGNDELRGGADNDNIWGGGGNDALYGDEGDDVLFGQDGNDVLDGGTGEDALLGGAGEDVLIASGGSAELYGGAGNDTYIVTGNGNAFIDDSEGANVLIAHFDADADVRIAASGDGITIIATTGQWIELSAATLQSLTRLDLGSAGTFDSVDAAIAALYQPTRTSNPETDPFYNVIRLGANVTGGEIGLIADGRDLVLSYSGTQQDWIDIDDLRARGVLLALRDGSAYGLPAGAQVLVLYNWYDSQGFSYLGMFLDPSGTYTNFAAAAVDAVRRWSGTEQGEELEGTANADILRGNGGSDILSGLAGADELHGGAGDDLLVGGAGDDVYVVNLGDGKDEILDQLGTADVLRFGAGIGPADITVTQQGDDVIFHIGSDGNQSVRIFNWHTNETYDIERIEFQDGTVWTPIDVDAQLAGNHRPRVVNPIADQQAAPDESFSFTLPADAFEDPNPGDQLTYSVSLANGGTWPAWLSFDAATGTFSGTPTSANGGIYQVEITVTDQGGLSTTTQVNIRVPVPVELIGTSGEDTLTAATADDHVIHGLGGDDSLQGNSGQDVLEGGIGSDTLVGGGGSDTYVFDAADFISSQANMDIILGERDSATDSIDVIQFGAGIRPEDVRVSAAHGSDGVDIVLGIPMGGSNYYQSITVENGFSTQFGHEILDEVRFSDGTVWDREYLYQVAVRGSEQDDWIRGFDRDDVIRGYGGADDIAGGGGNDDITGGAGHDLINGGAGNDTYHFGRGQGVDQITDTAGTNRIVLDAGITPADVTLYRTSSRSSIASPWSESYSDSVVLVLDQGQEQLWIMDFYASATRGISEIVFADGTVWTSSDIDAHLINVRGVANTITGTAGDDEHTVDHPGDYVSETSDGGLDTVHSSVSYQLDYFVETLILTGILDINGIGNEHQNTIVGNAGANYLMGSYTSADAAADTLIGGAGDDVYEVDWHSSRTDNFNDVVIEAAGEGYDTIIANSYRAILPPHVERLILDDNRNYFYYIQSRSVTGNELDNVIDAQGATNYGAGFIIDGGLGADVMIGAHSAPPNTSDRAVRFVVDNAGDVVIGNSDSDVVQSSISYALSEGLEDIELTGSAAINGTGNSGNNRLDGVGNSAANVLTGGRGNDTYRLGADDSLVELAGEGRDTVIVTVAAGSYTINLASFANVENLTVGGDLLTATLVGTDEANELTGNWWENTLIGGGGDDLLDGSLGGDKMVGGTGNDTYVVEAVGDVVTELAGEGTDSVSSSITYTLGSALENLTLTGSNALNGTGNDSANNLVGNAQANTLTGLGGNDLLDGGRGADVLIGGSGDDIYIVDDADQIVEYAGAGIDHVQSQVSFTLSDNVENLTLLGYASNGRGNVLDNVIVGNAQGNRLDGGAGADTLSGGSGNDTYVVDHALDVVIEAAGQGLDTVESSVSFVLSAGLENLTLTGGADVNGTGNAADNVLIGNSGANTLAGGVGNDTYVIDRSDDLVVEVANAGTDTVQSYVSYILDAALENLTLLGTAELSATGNASNNLLIGNSANNVLAGGGGDDIYEVQNTGDVIVENAGEGNDTVRSSASYVLSENTESLLLTGTANIDGTGNALGNLIVGTEGANVLDGGAGNDRLIGGEGNDTYIVDAVGDAVIENSYEGTDTVRSFVSYTLDSTLEHLTLVGAANINATGNAGANRITGNDGDNILDGKAGADALQGGAGNDLFIVDDSADVVIEMAGGGVDAVQSSVTYTLSDAVENLTLVGDAYQGTGNALDNVLTGTDLGNQLIGGAGNDWLDGRVGRDSYSGGLGDDTYIVDTLNETITEALDEGLDVVRASATFTLSANVEHLVLTGSSAINGTGNALDNVITGNAGDNVLNGGTGNDLMLGGAGNDTYVVDSAGDTVVENAGEGIDTVQSSISYSLTDHVENLTLTGTDAINAAGNALDNVLTGNSGTNVLTGGAGNDRYVVNNTADVVVELVGEGIDQVDASISYTLDDNVENLTLTGTSGNSGTGNVLANVLVGNTGANTLTGGAGDDVLDGGGGSDQMHGGQGDDSYVVAQTGDTVSELANEGMDSVRSSVTYTLANNVENLTLTGTGVINGTGNESANTLTGNASANTLNGGAGADTMLGGAGNDTFIVDQAGDVAVELADEGTDTVQSLVTYTLGANVENLTLTGSGAIDGTGNALSNVLVGNSAINTLAGGAGADSLNGGAAADVLVGGAGDDTYFVDNTGDVVTENVDEGVDTVQSSATHTLSANVENLVLTNSSSINGTGNTLNNSITGNTGANVLDGGAGADVLSGGGGNDTYIVDDAGDVVAELASAGTDTVQASVSFALTANVENLTLTGSSNIDGTGNELANTLTGNSGLNVLSGLGGNDTYIVGETGDTVVEAADGGVDIVQSSATYVLGSNVENLTLTGTAAINGTGNELANVLTGNAVANVLAGGAGNDTLNGAAGADSLIGGAGDDLYVVDNTGDTVTEAADEGIDTVQSVVTHTLAANVENLTLSGSSAINATGNSGANALVGNTNANILDGGAGADSMSGGTGNDTYVVDDAGDSVVENANAGTDTVQTSISYTLGANVENLTLTGTANLDATGNELANFLTGNGGINTLAGGAGDDTYVVQTVGDVVTELAGAGTDTVQASITYTLADQVEHLTLTGTGLINGTGNDLNNNLVGNSVGNTLTGGAGNDLLNGGGGTDQLIGGSGDDTYVVDVASDVITELSGEGIDLVQAGATYTLGSNIEHLTLTGSGSFTATGNELNNTLTGNTGANTLNGGLGADTMAGAGGNDVYIVDDVGDIVVEAANAGTDTVQAGLSYALTANVENLTLTGTGNIDGTGNELANVLTGNAGSNVLAGLLGDDTYILDASADTLIEAAGEGTDTVQTASSYTLLENFENLTLTGSGAVSGTGNSANNVITGNTGANVLTGGAGNDTLNGGTGADTMIGGTGDDNYSIDNVGDIVTELADEGIDKVTSTLSHTLGSHFENLTLGGSASTGTGNELDNVLIGNSSANTLTGHAGNDTLDGGSGLDTMIGGTGDDTYVVNQANEITTENAGEGMDTVQSSVAHVLSANIERLLLTSTSSVAGTGNELANYLAGNTGGNTLTGLLGDDTLVGGNGADVYSYSAGHGADTIDNYSTDAAQDRLNITNLTRSEFTFSREGDDLLVSRNGVATDSIRVSNWFIATTQQLDFVQFSDQTLTAAEINALIPQGLMSSGTNASQVESTQAIEMLFALPQADDTTGTFPQLLIGAHKDLMHDWGARLPVTGAEHDDIPSARWMTVRNHSWEQPMAGLGQIDGEGTSLSTAPVLLAGETPWGHSAAIGRMQPRRWMDVGQ